MPTATDKLTRLADDILRSLDALEDDDNPRVAAIRGHVLALAQILGRGDTPLETPVAKTGTVRGFRPTTRPPEEGPSPERRPTAPHLEGKRPGLYTERRAARQQAGVTLQQVRQETGMSLATVRMYEVRPQSVRPDKRLQLDQVYASFVHPRTK